LQRPGAAGQPVPGRALSKACCGLFEAFAQRRCKKFVICAMPGGLEKHTGILYTGQGNS